MSDEHSAKVRVLRKISATLESLDVDTIRRYDDIVIKWYTGLSSEQKDSDAHAPHHVFLACKQLRQVLDCEQDSKLAHDVLTLYTAYLDTHCFED